MTKTCEQIINDLIKMNIETCKLLWNTNRGTILSNKLVSKLIFPIRRSGDLIISEQEARIHYCNVLNSNDYYYSVETPTENEYQQSGKGQRSGNTDLSLYQENDGLLEKCVNIEFKAKNCNLKLILKDFEQLIREGLIGNWFHLLDNADSGTIKSLFQRFSDVFKAYHKPSNDIMILFHICIVKMGVSFWKLFDYKNGSDMSNYIDQFFDFQYKASRKKIIMINQNGWQEFP